MDDRNPRAMGAFRADVARRYDAAPAKVFAAWTDATRAKAWLAAGGDLVMNPVAGGLFYIGMNRPAGKYPHYGRYLSVERDRKLEFTWVSEHTKGKESVVTISFEPDRQGHPALDRPRRPARRTSGEGPRRRLGRVHGNTRERSRLTATARAWYHRSRTASRRSDT